MKQDTHIDLKELNVDGGAVTKELLLEIQATISGLNIIRPKIIETTAYGAALAAGIGNKTIEIENINDLWKEDSVHKENESQKDFYEKKTRSWDEKINKLFL